LLEEVLEVRVLVADLLEVNGRAVEVRAMALRVVDPLVVVPVVSLDAGMLEPILPPHLVALRMRPVIPPHRLAAADASVPAVIVTPPGVSTCAPAVVSGILELPWTSAGAFSIFVELALEARLARHTCVHLLIHQELALKVLALLVAHVKLAFAS